MRKLIIKMFQFLGVFLISLLVLEAFLRLAEIETVSSTDFNPNIGRIKRSNFEYTFFNEGFSISKYNSHGFLGPDYSEAKHEGVISIALVGDSYIEGYQVFERNHLRSILESELNQKFDSVQVLNFGRSGFNFSDGYAYFQTFVSKFNPDITLFFFENSDLTSEQGDPLRPKVNIQNGNLIVQTNHYPKETLDTYLKTKIILQNSSVFQMMNDCNKLVKKGLFWPKVLDKLYWQKLDIESEGQLKIVLNSESKIIAKKLWNHSLKKKTVGLYLFIEIQVSQITIFLISLKLIKLVL